MSNRKSLSELPHRYSKMKRQENYYHSVNAQHFDEFEMKFQVGQKINDKTELDKWLTERYALLQDTQNSINEFEVHHIEWPTYRVDLNEIRIEYPRFDKLLNNLPNLTHYSTGVQVIAWDKRKNKKLAVTKSGNSAFRDATVYS